jgi:hypothetical protein
MKFTTSLKILFKSQLISALALGLLTTFSLALSGKDGFNALFALPINAILFFLLSAPVYYTFGIIFHRMFLKYDLHKFVHTIILSIALAGLFPLLVVVGVGSFPEIDVLLIVFLQALIIILPQTLLIRYLTLKELRKG